MNEIIKKKFIYPLIMMLAIFFGSLIILTLNRPALSIEKELYSDYHYPGTRWSINDNLIGASKIKNSKKNSSNIELVEFENEIYIPELPPLPEVILTEEDK